MIRGSRGAIGVAALCVGVLTVGAVGVSESKPGSKKPVYKTRVAVDGVSSIDAGRYAIVGEIVSKRRECRIGRKVRMSVLDSSNVSTTVDAGKTNAEGRFSLAGSAAAGDRAYVVAPAKDFVSKSGKTSHCDTGHSPYQDLG
ncbi:MAG: hypothetical protein ACXWFH_11335 [Solirubrobacterales bacterium]